MNKNKEFQEQIEKYASDLDNEIAALEKEIEINSPINGDRDIDPRFYSDVLEKTKNKKHKKYIKYAGLAAVFVIVCGLSLYSFNEPNKLNGDNSKNSEASETSNIQELMPSDEASRDDFSSTLRDWISDNDTFLWPNYIPEGYFLSGVQKNSDRLIIIFRDSDDNEIKITQSKRTVTDIDGSISIEETKKINSGLTEYDYNIFE